MSDPAGATDDLVLSNPAQGVLQIQLNRPERRNALATPLLQRLAAALEQADRDSDVRVVILCGHAKVFAAGADIGELAASTPHDPVESPRFKAWAAMRRFSKPLLAAVEGWCLGAGLELALCADLIVAARGARLGLPETGLGIMPGAGGTAILPRRVGTALAMQMALTGDPITAEQALAAGLVMQCVDDGEALQATLALAQKLAARAPLALQAAKASVKDAATLDETAHLLAERRRFLSLLGTADEAEGLAAFLEKRPPVWRGC